MKIKILLILVSIGIVFSKSIFADTSKNSVNQNLNNIAKQINQINQDLGNNKQKKTSIEAAIKSSNTAIEQSNNLLKKLTQKITINQKQLDLIAGQLPEISHATTQAEASVQNSIVKIYQQIQQIRVESASIFSSNSSLEQGRKKVYLVSLLNLQQQKYINLKNKLTTLNNLQAKLQAEITRLNKQVERTSQKQSQLVQSKLQQQQQTTEVYKKIEVGQKNLSGLKQKQAKLNNLLSQLASTEKVEKTKARLIQVKANKVAKRKVKNDYSNQQVVKQASAKAGQSTITVVDNDTNSTTVDSGNDHSNPPAATPISSAKQTSTAKIDNSFEDSSPFLHRDLVKPINGNVTIGFGELRSGIRNNGLLITAADNSGVYSISNGKVLFSGELPGFGQIIVVDNGDNYTSVYSGIKSLVQKGNKVTSGQVIANSGTKNNQPMGGVYLELRHLGKPVNPTKLMN